MTRSSVRAPERGHVLHLDVVHDDAMLGRIVAILGPHPVGAFSYTPAAGDGPTPRHGARARVLVEVTGGSRHVRRVAHRLDRLVGVIEVTGVESPAR